MNIKDFETVPLKFKLTTDNLKLSSWCHVSRTSQPTIKKIHLESPEVTHTKVIIFIVHHNRTIGGRVAKVELGNNV